MPSICHLPSAICHLLSALALAALLAGCQSGPPNPNHSFLSPTGPATGQRLAVTNRIDPTWLQPPTQLFTLGPGDRLDIEIVGDATSRSTTVVAPDGRIYYSLLPGIDVWGLTLAQARAKIEDGMSQYVRERPQVSLVLRGVESKHIWVLGHVQAPGVFPLATPTTLLEAISLAGGTLNLSSYRQQDASAGSQELADLRRSFVLRDGKLLPVDFQRLLLQGDLSQNIYLQPDDFIYFPAATASEVYVLGAVAQPRAVPYKRGLTTAMAVASAYGTVNGAYMHHVAVVRGSLSQPEITIIDYKAVIRGEATDIALEPGDIVYVPFSPYRYLTRYAQLILDTFVSSVAINGGQKWIGLPQGGASVFIPVGTVGPSLPAISPPPVK